MNDTIFSDHIKVFTRFEHAQLEKKLVTIIKNIQQLSGYVSLLRMFYGYYHALEHAMQPHLTLPDAGERRKSAAILQDIHDLGATLELPAVKATLPVINNYPQALGAAYVLEGSTLGGTIIAKMICGQLQIPAERGFSFFNSYGNAAMEMWRKFRSYLDLLQSEEERDEAAVAAKNTFLTFNEWVKIYEPIFKI